MNTWQDNTDRSDGESSGVVGWGLVFFYLLDQIKINSTLDRPNRPDRFARPFVF